MSRNEGITGLQRRVKRLEAALKQIQRLAPSGARPDEEDYDDTESASSKGYDAGQYDAAHQCAGIARRALAVQA